MTFTLERFTNMDLIPEAKLDRSLAIENNIPGPTSTDIALVLLNYVKATKNNIILNEFMHTTGKQQIRVDV